MVQSFLLKALPYSVVAVRQSTKRSGYEAGARAERRKQGTILWRDEGD